MDTYTVVVYFNERYEQVIGLSSEDATELMRGIANAGMNNYSDTVALWQGDKAFVFNVNNVDYAKMHKDLPF
jgi:hypothetical protein